MAQETTPSEPIEKLEAAFAVMERAAALRQVAPDEDVAELALMAKRVADRLQAAFVESASRPDAPRFDRLFDSPDTPLLMKIAILQADAGISAEEALERLGAAKASATLADLRAAVRQR
jgi:hypothetical protein